MVGLALPLPKERKECQSLSCVRLFVTSWTVPTRLLCPWDSPGRNTGVGCHWVEIFPTQGPNPGLPHCRHSLLTKPLGKPTPSWSTPIYFPYLALKMFTQLSRNWKIPFWKKELYKQNMLMFKNSQNKASLLLTSSTKSNKTQDYKPHSFTQSFLSFSVSVPNRNKLTKSQVLEKSPP